MEVCPQLCPSLAQETLDTLRKAMANTRIMCAVMLDTKVRPAAPAVAAVHAALMMTAAAGRLRSSIQQSFTTFTASSQHQHHLALVNLWQGPEIRTGFLKDPDTPLTFTAGKTIKITTDYEHKGDEEMISMRCAALC